MGSGQPPGYLHDDILSTKDEEGKMLFEERPRLLRHLVLSHHAAPKHITHITPWWCGWHELLAHD